MKTGLSFALVAGSVLGALAVAGGAFGTHALQDAVSEARLRTYETAMRYLLAHSILLVSMSAVNLPAVQKVVRLAGILVLSGICVFSGSLVLLVLLDLPALGMIAPIGGVLLIAGWICLAVAAIRYHRDGMPK